MVRNTNAMLWLTLRWSLAISTTPCTPARFVIGIANPERDNVGIASTKMEWEAMTNVVGRYIQSEERLAGSPASERSW